MNVALFRNQVKIVKVGLNPVTGVPIEEENARWRQAHTGRTPTDDRSREWSEVAVSQTTPMISGKNQKLGEEAEPCRHLDLRLLACRTVREYISDTLSHFALLCYSSSRKQTEIASGYFFGLC